MFRGVQLVNLRIAHVNNLFDTAPSRIAQVVNLQFSRTNTAMAAADGAAGATSKTLKMENVSGPHPVIDRH